MFRVSERLITEFEELAADARYRREFAKAKSLYTCLIPMIKKVYGNESERLAVSFFKLAEIYSDEGNYRGAEVYYSRATEIWAKKHPDKEQNGLWRSQALTNIQTMSEQSDAELEEGRQDEGNVA